MGKQAKTGFGGWCGVALGGLLLGCGGFSGSQPTEEPVATVAAAEGFLDVHLVKDGVAPEFGEMTVLLSGLEIEVAGSWRPVPLAAPGAAPGAIRVDLLALDSEHPRSLATQVPWPAGANTRLRLTFGGGGSVTLAEDDSREDLEAPKALVAGLGLPGVFSVPAKASRDLWIALDVAHVAAPAEAGGPHRFQPLTVRGYDRAATGVITGRLLAASPAATAADKAAEPGQPEPLAGIPVTAQLLRSGLGEGGAVPFRTVRTDPEGRYSLDLLPQGYTWCVVSQPQVGAVTYAGAVAEGLALGKPPLDASSRDLTCSPAEGPGVLAGSVAGPFLAGEILTVDLLQTVPFGGAAYPFAIRSAPVVITDGKGAFAIKAVPPGRYSAVLNRCQTNAELERVTQRRATAVFSVGAGEKVTLGF